MYETTKLINMGNCLGKVFNWKPPNQKAIISLTILQQGDGYQPPSEVYIDNIIGLKELRDALNEAIKKHEDEEITCHTK